MFTVIPEFLAFIRRNYMAWDYNKRQLHGLTSDVCGKYCCLFGLYMNRGYIPQQFVALFDVCNEDRHVERMFTAEFGGEMLCGGWGQCCHSCLYK